MIGPSRASVAAAMIAVLSTVAVAQPGGNPKTEQAAIRQARKALAAKLGPVRLTAKATVADCLKSNKRIAADVEAYLGKLRPVGKPRWYADGSCEVDLQVKLAAFLTTLRKAVERHYLGTRITPADIDAKIAQAGDVVIRVVGVVAGEPAAAIATRPTALPGIWTRYCTAEARAKAATAAIVDARRKLLRKIQRLKLADGVTVADLMAANDEIHKGTDRYIAELPIKGRPTYRAGELIVDVTIEVRVRQVAEQLKKLYLAHGNGEAVKAADFDRLAKARTKMLRTTGSGAPPEQLAPAAGAQRSATPLRRPKWPKRVRATGADKVDPSAANVGQAKLLAMRRAEQAARKKLTQQVESLRVTAALTVRQFAVAAGPGALADIKTYLSGATVVRSQVSEKGDAKTVVELSTDRLWKIVHFWRQRRTGR